MRFAITHPMVTRPYDPALVSGKGIAVDDSKTREISQ